MRQRTLNVGGVESSYHVSVPAGHTGALPVIVADLGGVEHYSWVATSALLTSAVVIPIVGKLADMYGRRGFYIGGLLVFLAGSALAGAVSACSVPACSVMVTRMRYPSGARTSR